MESKIDLFEERINIPFVETESEKSLDKIKNIILNNEEDKVKEKQLINNELQIKIPGAKFEERGNTSVFEQYASEYVNNVFFKNDYNTEINKNVNFNLNDFVISIGYNNKEKALRFIEDSFHYKYSLKGEFDFVMKNVKGVNIKKALNENKINIFSSSDFNLNESKYYDIIGEVKLNYPTKFSKKNENQLIKFANIINILNSVIKNKIISDKKYYDILKLSPDNEKIFVLCVNGEYKKFCNYFKKKTYKEDKNIPNSEKDKSKKETDDFPFYIFKKFKIKYIIIYIPRIYTNQNVFMRKLNLIEEENKKIRQENEKIRQEYVKSREENEKSREENEKIRQEYVKSREENEKSREENEKIRQENEKIRQEMSKENEKIRQEMSKENEKIKHEYAKIKEKNNELKNKIDSLFAIIQTITPEDKKILVNDLISNLNK